MGVLIHQQPPGSRTPECTRPGGAGREPGQCHLLPPGLLASSSGSSPPASPTPSSWKTYSPPDNGHLCLHVGTPNHGHTGLETPLPGLPSGFLNKDCGLRFLLPQTHRVHTSPGAPTAVREARVARARPHLPRAAGRGGAYPGPWPGSCCRSRRGCRAGWRTPTPPGRCPPRRSRPRRSRARAARTAAWTATPPSS